MKCDKGQALNLIISCNLYKVGISHSCFTEEKLRLRRACPKFRVWDSHRAKARIQGLEQQAGSHHLTHSPTWPGTWPLEMQQAGWKELLGDDACDTRLQARGGRDCHSHFMKTTLRYHKVQ